MTDEKILVVDDDDDQVITNGEPVEPRSHGAVMLGMIAASLGVQLPAIREKKPYTPGTGLQPWTGTPAPTKAALRAARERGREKGRKS